MTAPVEAQYLELHPNTAPGADGDADAGRRFALHHTPPGNQTPQTLVLYLHPFAEEMNKSRRMAALQSRALAAAGCAVLQVDLHGCGDSPGDFGDATWASWLADAQAAAQWLRQRHSHDGRTPPLWLWGLRAGALLAAATAARIAAPAGLLLWQPQVNGKLALQQFLRLKAAADLLAGQAKGVTEALRGQLRAGQAVEIAGYCLAPGLAHGLESAALTPPETPCRLEWLELSTADAPTLPPAAAQAVTRWRAAGCMVRTQVVRGPAFWQTTEIEDAPALLDATLVALAAGAANEDLAPAAPIAA